MMLLGQKSRLPANDPAGKGLHSVFASLYSYSLGELVGGRGSLKVSGP